MSKDWQKGSGYVKEPKIVKDPWTNKDGYSQAKKIEEIGRASCRERV